MFVQPLFSKKADPIRKRLQQKNLSVWKGFRLKIKSSKKLSLGEYGRQRTSKKFHDLVLDLKFQNSRVLETIVFLALFSRRKGPKHFLMSLKKYLILIF